jgi:hypothetical protein
MRLKVRLPSDDLLEIEVDNSICCGDICLEILKSQSAIHFKRLYLLYEGQILDKSRTLNSYNITEDDIMIETLIDYSSILSITEESCTKEYIKSTMPYDGEKMVGINIQPCVYFQSNSTHNMLYLSNIANSDALIECADGDMVKNLGLEEAKSRGFVKWCDKEFKQHIYLLEVTDGKLKPNIEQIRYNVSGINRGYNNGDRYSWQRYTNKLPIPCYIHVDETDNFIRIIPEEPLSLSTMYVLLISNSIPNPPLELVESHIHQFTGIGTCDDFVIFFTTTNGQVRKATLYS